MTNRHVIENARLSVQKHRDTMSYWQKRRLRRRAPWWAWVSRDELLVNHFAQKKLHRRGELVWGVMVQANSMLFSIGEHDCPGVVAFSFDKDWSDDPGDLDVIARWLYGCKQDERSEDPDVQFIGSRLRDERGRYLGTLVPHRLSIGRDVRMASVMFYRQDLPGGYLSQRVFPILADPQGKALCVLPGDWWTEGMAEL